MAQALPAGIQLALDQALAQWRQWDARAGLDAPPALVQQLGSGLSNYSFLVGNKPGFVVRIDGISPNTFGLSRQTEWRILQSAHEAGIAPRPCYFNPQLGALVCEFVAPDGERESPEDIAQLLRSIHALPGCHKRLDLGERLARYVRTIKSARNKPAALTTTVLELAAKVQQQMLEASHPTTELRLCHNDLLRANRISSGSALLAIDWEYAAMGNPWYDLAAVVAGDELSTHATEKLLEAYLHRPPGNQEWEELHHFCCVYRCIELLWYLCRDATAQGPALQRKLQRLQAQSANHENW
tara:strand:+ start:185596 stop:186489 length:894 start_codon:yes stop_codon:yes gene_type:complete